MEAFFNQFGVWVGIGTAVVIGIVAIFGVFDTQFRSRRKVVDGTEDRIILLLQTEVGELIKKVNAQEKEIITLRTEIRTVKTENDTLMKVLQGRDDRAEKFYTQSAESMALSKQTNQIVMALSDDMRNLIAVLKEQT